jgi:hypothetical protein
VFRSLRLDPAVQAIVDPSHSRERCCQTNGNLFPVGEESPNPTWLQAMTDRHTASAAERLSL